MLFVDQVTASWLTLRRSTVLEFFLGQYVPGYSRAFSSVRYNTLSPVWNQDLSLPLECGFIDAEGEVHNEHTPFTTLVVEVWDYDRMSPPGQKVGFAKVVLAALMDGCMFEATLELVDDYGERCGEIEMRLQLS